MKKLLVLASGAVGYVLGSRAGRERYEQIRRMAMQVKQDPRVQQKAHQAADLAKEKAPEVKEKVAGVAGAAAGKVRHGSDEPDPTMRLNPDSTALQDDPYPKGDLP